MAKTIVENSTGLSKYLFTDDKPVIMGSDKITVGSDPVDFFIGDLNSGNATLHQNVTNAPADWFGSAYTFDGTSWAAVPGFVNPRANAISETEGNNSAQNADLIQSGFEITGALSNAADVDFYSIDLVAGTISIFFDAPNRQSEFFKIDTLFDSGSGLTTLHSRETGKDISFLELSTETQTIANPGTYYFSIAPFLNFTSGSYGLTVVQHPLTNQLPVANNDTATAIVGQSTIIPIGANDSDPDGNELATRFYELTTRGNKGTVTFNNITGSPDTATYTPNAGATGTDTFKYQVNDGRGGIDTAEVTVTIVASGANSPPTAEDDAATTSPNNQIVINIGANDSDADDDELTTTILSNPPASIGFVSLTDNIGAPDTVRFVPAVGVQSASTSFTYQVTDPDGASDTATVSITIQNDNPTAGDDTATTRAGTPVTINIGANDSHPQNEELTTRGVTNPTKGSVIYTENVGRPDTALYTPDAGVRGTDTFIYRVTDTNGNTDDATVTVNLGNNSPVARDDTASATPGVPVTINIGANDTDEDNDQLTTSGITNPAKGSVRYTENVGSPDTAVYTASLGATGTDSFQYSVTDGNGNTDTATVTITLQNNKPSAGDDSINAIKGVPVTINIGANDTHPSNDELITTGITNPLQGSVRYIDNVGAPDSAVYTPFPTASGTDSFTYQITDSAGASDTATVTVTFPNNPPVANDDFVTVSSGQSIRIKIGLNDTDEDGDALASSIVTNATQGTTSLVDNSNFYDIVNYTPNENAIGTDSFVYQITDGKGGSNSAVVFITIESSPVVSGSEVYRFFDTINNTHFFSTDEFEANHILINLPHYRLEGPAFQAADPINGPTKDVFRFFNTQSGTHLFTQDENERDHIINNSPHFDFEGTAYQGHPENVDGAVPLYRFFNTQTGGHFYTVNEVEKDNVIATMSEVYNFENIAYYVYNPTPTEIAPIQSDPTPVLGVVPPAEEEIGFL